MNKRMCQMMGRHGMMKGKEIDWCFPSGKPDDENVILIGLNPKPFEDARKEDIRNTVIISGVLVVLGLAGFISMFWMHHHWSASNHIAF